MKIHSSRASASRAGHACRHGVSFILSLAVCMLLLVGTAQAQQSHRFFDPEATAPYKVWDATPAITMTPLVLDVSRTSVEIVWTTDAPTDGRVRYGEDKLDQVALPETNGLVPVDTVHRVVIDGLKPGHAYKYQVASRRVVQIKPYWPEMGHEAKSKVHSFTTFREDKPEASFAFITDTHEDVGRLQALMKMIHDDPVDFVVHGGDVVDHVDSAGQLRHKFLEPVAKALDGSKPLLYVRGNHENRGAYARQLGKYLYAQKNRYYYTRDAGPLHLVVVDTGEDKPDETNVYAGLNNMRQYKRQERAWFADVLSSDARVDSAPFTVVLGHQPSWGWSGGHDHVAEWTRLANAAHVDLFIAGHTHHFGFIKAGERGNDFPILIVGQDQVAHVEANGDKLSATVTNREGKVLHRMTLHRKSK